VSPGSEIRPGLAQPIQAALALGGLVAASPVLLACAVAVKLSSPGPILFRQKRVGRRGEPFELYKFRTMTVGGSGAQVTASGDQRITAIGSILRKTKLDELPELWNVVNGSMALIGPRPEVPRYVDLADPLWCAVLEARPGITSPMAVQLRDEEAVMAGVDPGERERFYVESLTRYKLLGHLDYLRKRTPVSDLGVLAQTALAIVARRASQQPSPEEIAQAARGLERAS
jgi:lipopolysaccharide/colanic/teichoic acid biosynthesis glycosyltransferase